MIALVIDDNPTNLMLLQHRLVKLGNCQVVTMDSAEAALAWCETNIPDLILTDVHMQPMTGIELVREVRSNPNSQLSRTPVIFLSADSSAGTVTEALPLGVAGYLVKPPNLTALAAKIEQALKST